jgi:hypothetical protein
MKTLEKIFFGLTYVFLLVQSLRIMSDLILEVDSFGKGVSTLFVILLWGFLLYMGGVFVESIIKKK